MPLFNSHPAPEPDQPAPAPAPAEPTGGSGFFNCLCRDRDHPTPASTLPGATATAYHSAHHLNTNLHRHRLRAQRLLLRPAEQCRFVAFLILFLSLLFFRAIREDGTFARRVCVHRAYLLAPIKSNGGGSLLSTTLKRYTHRIQQDPSVVEARTNVARAAEVEAEADRAVLHARARAREAMESVQVLEGEGEGESNRVKVKGALTRLVGKDAGALGRHGG
ncbi:hypothetical protein B0H13DRAFT_2351548 [Mycena leptocephala]|nr:hypothetical protein B0H13DRAFT_2351548 [Mycena leptocephala]